MAYFCFINKECGLPEKISILEGPAIEFKFGI